MLDYFSWAEFERLSEILIEKLRDYRFDAIVGISVGGLPLTAVVANAFNIKPLIIGIKYYRGINLTDKKPLMYQKISNSLCGKYVLLIDDIADSGDTLEFAKEHIYQHGAKSVVIATLHMKPTCSITPDVYAMKTNKWVVYPWEREYRER